MRFVFLSLISLVILTGEVWSTDISADKRVQLLTNEEASMAEEKVFGFSEPLPHEGPVIKVLQPSLDSELHNPFKLHIKFVPRDGGEVNLNSLKVEALKIVNVNITPRLLPYASREGIKMDKVEIPSGRHRIRVSLKDMSGRETQEVFAIHVN